MKQQTVFLTCDNSAHNTQKLALAHIDKKQGELKSRLAHRICQTDNYVSACGLVDSIDLWQLIADIQMWESDKYLPDDDDDDDDDY